VAARVNAAGTDPPTSTPGRPSGSAGIGPEAPSTSPAHTRRMVASMASKRAPRPERDSSLAA
jgi:hypothetical protein